MHPLMGLSLLVALAAAGCQRPGPAVAARAAARERPDPAALRAALADGQRAYARRGEPAALEEALRAFGQAAALAPGDPAAELPLARAWAFKGLSARGSAEARDAWDASARAAERALRRLAPGWAEAIDRGDPASAAAARVEVPAAEALYWLALGSMRRAQATGVAAVLAAKDAAVPMMERAAALDERVDAAGPHRALGAWSAALPVAAGGGAAASRAHFDRARALFPEEQLGRVLEAETYAVLVQDAGLFDGLLAEVIAFPPARWPERAPENALAQRLARELQARRARLF
jgi:TRAP transporter TatT component family protein